MTKKRAYFIGIKGVGMTALAQLLKANHYEVVGSDVMEKFFTDEVLRKLKIKVFEGFDENNVIKNLASVYIASSAYNEKNNPEIVYLKKNNIQIFSYAEMLGKVFNENHYGIVITGTHGKTTTTALVGSVLREAKLDPTVVVGSRVRAWGTNAISGKSKYWVIEGDEYQNKLSYFNPKIVILTHLEYDHPDFFSDFASYKNTFKEFVKRIPRDGYLIAFGDNKDVRDVAKFARCKKIFYGYGARNDIRLLPSSQDESSQTFQIVLKDKKTVSLTTQLVGDHNALNSVAAYALGKILRVSDVNIKNGISKFEGTSRRFEIIKKKNPIVIDDYAHHPTEVQATLAAARKKFPNKKIIAVFHPHTFSRTEALLDDFAKSFNNADHVIVIEVYGSAREKKGKVGSKDLIKKMKEYSPVPVEYARDLDAAFVCTQKIEKKYSPSDLVIITIGAGDVWKVAKKLAEN
ncbi:MAG: UDP-N-acetylmuramate--L-alanine ligase [Parcubacteria group bacterium]|nr:UDP-N-acetylmuramate--L-alanine ligase [Parcubacteria group bacterium]